MNGNGQVNKRVCVFTGTRADYGLLKPLIARIAGDPELTLQLLVSGAHLSPEFGLTFREIEQDGFAIDEKVEMLTSSDSPVGIGKAMGLGLIGYAEALDRLKPELLVVLGDRFEALAVAAAAVVARIPIAHLHGGETTVGASDEAWRHAITKMSHLHFTSTKTYRKRVIQLGEDPTRVFNVGALGVENIRSLRLLELPELEQSLNIAWHPPVLLITHHPVTLENRTAAAQFAELLTALADYPQCQLIFTKANADTDGRVINLMIDNYTQEHPGQAHAFTSLGQLRYLSAMRHAAAVIGNSSSGIIEAPSLRTPTVNIGDRQKGRERAESVIDCPPERAAIATALTQALSPEFKEKAAGINNPYEKPGTSKMIVDTIKKFDLATILKKEFHDLP